MDFLSSSPSHRRAGIVPGLLTIFRKVQQYSSPPGGGKMFENIKKRTENQ